MARPAKNFPVILEVQYVPIPEEKISAWRMGITLLLDLLYEERTILEQERANENTASGIQSSLCITSPEDG